MFRLIIALIILALCLKSDAQVSQMPECDYGTIKKDAQGCFPIQAFVASRDCVIPVNSCFAIPVTIVDEFGHAADTDHPKAHRCSHKDTPEYLAKYGKEQAPFSKEAPEERKKIITILDTSALALLKNSMLQNVNIVFFDKGGKFSNQFQKEAEKYLLDKGVKKGQFSIKIINKVER
jgi:hypothetical protein